MRILVSGASGVIGSRLVNALTDGGHEVLRLVRSRPDMKCVSVFWDPYEGKIEEERLSGIDAVVHLSGESIAGRWTSGRKKRIRESRVVTTRFLSRVLSEIDPPPGVLVSASAIGFYGDRGAECLTEESEAGSSFLSGLCQEWEEATQPATQSGIRVVNLRIGVVLSHEGGALKQMLLPFKLGLGGRIGRGNQYWSWVVLDDVVGAIIHTIATDSIRGPVNAVSPNPVTNQEFTRALGRALSRPTVFPLPAFALRAALGEMANDLLLASARIVPVKLTETAYKFQFPELDVALRHLFKGD